jgi:hypothetical protein
MLKGPKKTRTKRKQKAGEEEEEDQGEHAQGSKSSHSMWTEVAPVFYRTSRQHMDEIFSWWNKWVDEGNLLDWLITFRQTGTKIFDESAFDDIAHAIARIVRVTFNMDV